MGGVVSGGLNLLRGSGGSGDRAKSQGLQQEAFNYLRDVRAPLLEELQIGPDDIEYFQVTGKFTPALYQATQMDKTLLEDLEIDPSLVKDQMAGIASKKSRIAEGGLSIEDRARMQEVLRETERQNRAQQESVGARMRERGMTGGPGEMLARLEAQGRAADSTANDSFKIASLAALAKGEEEDKLQNMLGQMAQQDFTTKSTRAQAEAERQKFNTALMNQQNQTNVQTQNVAQMQNLQDQQRVADANVGLSNQRVSGNKNAVLQDYQNKLNLAQNKATAGSNYAGYLSEEAKRKEAERAAQNKQIGNLVDGAASALFGGFGK